MPDEPVPNTEPPLHAAEPGGDFPGNVADPPPPAAAAAAMDEATLPLEAGDMKSYLLLRQSIDLFQAIALAFYATGKTVQERAQRAGNVHDNVIDFKEGVMDDGCAAGERRLSNGTCVPNDGLFLGERLIILPQ